MQLDLADGHKKNAIFAHFELHILNLNDYSYTIMPSIL